MTDLRAVVSRAALVVSVACLLALERGEALQELKVNGQAGFWNQVVVGREKAFEDRIGGVTVHAQKPVVSFVDRDKPTEFAKRWDITTTKTGEGAHKLEIHRGAGEGPKLMSLDTDGNAIFKGQIKVDGVLRVKTLQLQGVAYKETDTSKYTLKIGTSSSAGMRFGVNKNLGWVQSDNEANLVFNADTSKAGGKMIMFSDGGFLTKPDKTVTEPTHTLDVRGNLHVTNSVNLGADGKTTLTKSQLTFALGGGWTTSVDKNNKAWIASLKTKPVQFGGAFFEGKSATLGAGIEVHQNIIGIDGKAVAAEEAKKWKVEVHEGHFVVTSKVGAFLKGLTTYIMPQGAHVKAYDYTRKELQKWRISGTRILLNPDQKADGRVCIGCEIPEHHLQSEGNMYVNGNVFVNKHLHVKGHMHIDKIITPKVFIHSRKEEDLNNARGGVMIGNDLPNKWKTTTNMRIGYNEKFAWIQSHKEVPLVINPIGGATAVGGGKSPIPAKNIELHVFGHTYMAGEMFVATKKKTKAPTPAPAPTGNAEQQMAEEESFSLAEAKTLLEKEMGATELNVMSAWSSATKIVQDNHKRISQRQAEIRKNEAAIQALERQLMR